MARAGYCRHDRYIDALTPCHECAKEREDAVKFQDAKIKNDLILVRNNFLKLITDDPDFRESIIKILLLTEQPTEACEIYTNEEGDIVGPEPGITEKELQLRKEMYYNEVLARNLVWSFKREAFSFMILNPMVCCLYHRGDQEHYRIRWNEDKMIFQGSEITDQFESGWWMINNLQGDEGYYIPKNFHF